MAKKRGHNEGCISKRKDGLWASIVTVGRNPDGSLRRRTFYGKTRKEVGEKLNNALSELNKGSYVDPNKITVASWIDQWLWSYKLTSVKPKTFSSYKMLMDTYIIPSIGKISLQDLNTDDVQNIIVDMSEKNLSARTIRYSCTVLRAALDQACKNSLINQNVCKNVVMPQQERKTEARIMSLKDQGRFLETINAHRLVSAYLLLLSTGCRIGELLALTWDNVDLDNALIRITQTLQRVRTSYDENSTQPKSKLLFGTPKTDKGNRYIPLLDTTVKALKVHKQKQLEEIALADNAYTDSGLVFCTELGLPIEPNNLRRSFRKLLSKAGVPNINIHGLRHTFATRGLENGIELKVMQEILGHANVSITGDIYSHVMLDKKKSAIHKLKDIFKTTTSDTDK